MSSEKCRNTALRYVAMRMRTEGQVADYLRRKEFEEADIADAIGFLREYRYVDDVRYCRMYFREACLKGRGRRRIEQEQERMQSTPVQRDHEMPEWMKMKLKLNK